MFFNTKNITNTKITRLANVSNIALKVHYTVKQNTNVPGILRCKNYGAIIKYNSGKSKLGLNWDPIIKSSVSPLDSVTLLALRMQHNEVRKKLGKGSYLICLSLFQGCRAFFGTGRATNSIN